MASQPFFFFFFFLSYVGKQQCKEFYFDPLNSCHPAVVLVIFVTINLLKFSTPISLKLFSNFFAKFPIRFGNDVNFVF